MPIQSSPTRTNTELLQISFTVSVYLMKCISTTQNALLSSMGRTPTLMLNYSRNVNKFVCTTLSARSASRSSITQEMLISLAPTHCLA